MESVPRPVQKALQQDSGGADSASCESLQLCLCLFQVEAHVHLAVHRRRDREVLLSLLTLCGSPVELAKAEVAVGDERAPAAGLGECQRPAVVCLAALGVGAVGKGRTVTQQKQRTCPGSGLTRCQFDGAFAEALRVIKPP